MRKVSHNEAFCEGYKKKCPNDKTCKFYKPYKDWIRIGDYVFPPEERNNKEAWVEL